ncbi:PREDICTED: cAMP-regulated phosphoprotein 21-like [Ipomoea nil]|uniref:cAMP-regulated phosphoprotein 21-like n=1 Tax=Ipomoea nil TaxID=35883 RepID=UPI000900C3A1|nr:PREDICTED: cAMP-regulated phosphoprotein 21-like [Ipomoea nil]XP_019162899.1 PREDICTED: cAMP-regulated phosphoprotein 21-like [Ipomoea nil]
MATHVVSPSAAAADVVSTPEVAPAYLSMVDPFLVEALQNPRHRLTILRMELDVQKFLQNPDLEQFEFPHFPTSYLRLAAHRVAQHYGLLTMVDNVVDGQGTRILVKKKVDTKYPTLCLSDVPPKQSESEKLDQKRIVLRSRPSRALTGQSELGAKHSAIRTMEERKEEYDRARARIFNGPNNFESEDSLVHSASDGRDIVDENEYIKSSVLDLEKIFRSRENRPASRVAIFRDREKDLTDPDYDRSYERYVNKNIPVNQSFNMTPFGIQKFQPPYVQYDSGFPVQGQMPGTPASFNYSNPLPNPYCVMGGLNQMSTEAANMQWPTQSMMYAHSYEQLRHVAFQAPFYQQPLSFDYSQHHS